MYGRVGADLQTHSHEWGTLGSAAALFFFFLPWSILLSLVIPSCLASANMWLRAGNSLELPGKAERALSPGNMSEDDRRDLIARQRSALYGEGAFVDEHGTSRPGGPGYSSGPSSHRGPSPLAYDYSRGTASVADSESHGHNRANSNASPQSNPPTNLGVFDNGNGPQATRTSNSSPNGGSPPHHSAPSGKPNQAGSTVAPIGTRPSGVSQNSNSAMGKRSTTPLPSPLSQGYSTGDANAKEDSKAPASANPASATAEGYNGWGGNRAGVWGNKSNLGVQASVWG